MGPFSPLYGSVAVHTNDDLIAKLTALLEQRNVAHMQDVKTAVGEDNAIAVRTPFRQTNQQMFEIENLVRTLHLGRRGELGHQLVARDGRSSRLGDHDARGNVRQVDGSLRIETAGQRRRQGGDDRIAGAGNVEDFARPGWRMKNGIGIENANALLAHGDGHVIDAELRDQLLRRGQQFRQVAAGNAGDQPEFLKIRADGGGAGIFAEVPTLGIDQHGDASLPGQGDDRLAKLRRSTHPWRNRRE